MLVAGLVKHQGTPASRMAHGFNLDRVHLILVLSPVQHAEHRNVVLFMEKTKSFALIIAVLALSLGAVYLALGFTEPSVAPPAGNVPAPLNVGSSGQSKSGGLILNTGGAAYGLIVDKGNVGIGTPNPGAKLEVAGQVKITGGVPGAGKVLTSNASGLATWETISGATYSFGGIYRESTDSCSEPTCGPNPFTGGCNCPAGFTRAYLEGDGGSYGIEPTCFWSTAAYYCWK